MISLNDLSKPLVDCFKSVLRRYETDSKTLLDLTKPISSRQFNAFISRIYDAETQAFCKFLEYQLSDMKDSELRTLSAVKDDVNLMTPLITVDNRVMDKPLTLTDISRITSYAPSPLNNPTAFMNLWTTALMHTSLSGRDVRYILATLMPHIKIDTLIAECDTLRHRYDRPVEGEETIEGKYPWLSRDRKTEHIAELTKFLEKNAAQDRDITQVLNCKRKQNEPIAEYASGFLQCWKEQAKLQIKEEEDPFFCLYVFERIGSKCFVHP
ncbi:Hypothetical predicted protein [Xyrichtys novacula]|uniref:Retrotransposon gag domain-containing protein n=1 Tax=Xyrichtys novacula TaxID=13765 RepID=A0AAV1H5A7_XYRNO|nr:Hypothetical predicted protein [Xyrichtys novacula]